MPFSIGIHSHEKVVLIGGNANSGIKITTLEIWVEFKVFLLKYWI